MQDSGLNLNNDREKVKSALLIDDKAAVIAVLRDVLGSKSMVSVLFHPGDHFLLTMILDVNEKDGTLVLDYSTIPEVNKQLLSSEFKVFIAKMHGVVIEFFFDDLQNFIFEGKKAFRLNIPEKVIRLEHRTFHRVLTPLINPVKCLIKDASGLGIEASLIDISLSGMCITIPPAGNLIVEPESLFQGCKLILPEVGHLELTIAVVRTLSGPARKGLKSRLAGCAFVGLGRNDESKIAQYINKLEFSNKAKSII